MKKLLLIYIVLLFVVGCKSKEKKFDDLEMMVYHIGYNWSNGTSNFAKPILKCHLYIITDERGQAKMIIDNFDTIKGLECFKIDIDKNRINNLVDSLLLFPKFTFVRQDEPLIYDGFSMMIRVNVGDSSKTIKFIDRLDGNKPFLVKFYHYIDSLYLSGKCKATNDTVPFYQRRNEFIKHTLKMDSIVFPFIYKKKIVIRY